MDSGTGSAALQQPISNKAIRGVIRAKARIETWILKWEQVF